MSDYSKIKKIEGIKTSLKILIIACATLFTFFLLKAVLFFIRNFERGYASVGIRYLIGAIVSVLILATIAFVLPYLLIKLYPKIYYYEDGFTLGKNGKKIFYKKLDYFYVPAYNKVNTFLAIKFKNNEDDWENIAATGYSKSAFDLFQQDFLSANYQEAMNKIEAGETLEFLFNDPRKKIVAFGKRKYMEKKLEQALKIKVAKEGINFDGEKYDWDKYKIFVSLGNIIIQDINSNNILFIGDKALIHRLNLLEAIIDTLGKK